MTTIFKTGFAVSRSPWTSMNPSGAYLGGAQLGRPLSAAEIDAYTAEIKQGTAKLAQVRAWIASRIDADPMLRQTFTKGDTSQNFIVDNFWGYDDLVNKDQWYVDQTMNAINNPTSADYDIPDENLDRTDEWAKVVDIMYAAMQEYGGKTITPTPKPAVTRTGPVPVIPGVTPSATPNVKVAPGVAVPSAQPMILGVPQNMFLIGAGIAGLGLLAVALA